MNFLSKLLTVPETNTTKQIDVIQMWEVRWRSRKSEVDFDGHPELECFSMEAEAEEFAKALRNAFALIRITTMNRVTVVKGRSI